MTNQTPADIILQQLGGHSFRVMTGAKDFVRTGDGRTLQFKLPRGFATNKANFVQIALEDDLYTVRFMSFRGLDIKRISEHTMVPAQNLRSLFKEQTGLDVSI